MAMRHSAWARIVAAPLVFFVLIVAAACGGDSASPTDAGDTVEDAATVDSATLPDAGEVETVTLAGVVYGEAVDGGDPPPLEGATVSILWQDGTVFDTTTTAVDGSYELTAPRRSMMLHRIEPLEGYLGGLRAERVGGSDYDAYQARLAVRAGAVEAVAEAGSTYDPSLGFVVVGFNPVTPDAGGEGATLDNVTHDPAYGLYPGGAFNDNVLPRVCGETEDPSTDDCVPEGRLHQIFFPNVDGDRVSVRVISPSGGTCAARYDVSSYPVFADTLLKVNVDCE